MKQCVFSFLLLFVQFCYSQTDSVYLSIRKGLIPEYQIVYPNGDKSVVENYIQFKGMYWKGKVDTLALNAIISGNDKSKKSKSKREYILYGSCDSLVNMIRNEVYFHEVDGELDKYVYQEIGDNDLFRDFRNIHDKSFTRFSEKCFEEYSANLVDYRSKIQAEISKIKKSKGDRFEKISSNPSTISTDQINDLLSSFDQCTADLKSIELVILNKPEEFMSAAVSQFNSSDFAHFLYKLDTFPSDAKISEMKTKLKNTTSKSPRKKLLIKGLKKVK